MTATATMEEQSVYARVKIPASPRLTDDGWVGEDGVLMFLALVLAEAYGRGATDEDLEAIKDEHTVMIDAAYREGNHDLGDRLLDELRDVTTPYDARMVAAQVGTMKRRTVLNYLAEGTIVSPMGRLGQSPLWTRKLVEWWHGARPGRGWLSKLSPEEVKAVVERRKRH